jgi:acyl CoA:acetate/3-ketoacid CoA transferase beta subunit
VAVNSALEVDLYGYVNSTHVNGSKMLNGVGGSGDFPRNAPLSVIALPSTADGEDISRTVPMVPHADHTEHDIDIIVTEQGVADLRGTFPRERARELVENPTTFGIRRTGLLGRYWFGYSVSCRGSTSEKGTGMHLILFACSADCA